MQDTTEYKEWRKLFESEQKGKKPEDFLYQPVPEISIEPYLDSRESSGPSFFYRGEPSVRHHLVIDDWACDRLWNIAESLLPYYIKTVYGNPNVIKETKKLKALQSFNPERIVGYSTEDENAPLILDFRSGIILEKIRKAINKALYKEQVFWIIPGDDFIWNVSFFRGIKKYIHISTEESPSSFQFQTYLLLNQLKDSDNKSQLIYLSNQLLSMVLSGLNDYIWDVKNATDWQMAHLTYLMNIPEILVREGRIMTEKDPVQGSAFFEELSDKVVVYLQA